MKRLNRRFIFAFNIPPESEHERFSDDYSTNVMMRIIDICGMMGSKSDTSKKVAFLTDAGDLNDISQREKWSTLREIFSLLKRSRGEIIYVVKGLGMNDTRNIGIHPS